MRFARVIVGGALSVPLVVGCAGPPPALPSEVMARGAEALPEKHPKMTQQQLTACGDCHRTSDAPAK